MKTLPLLLGLLAGCCLLAARSVAAPGRRAAAGTSVSPENRGPTAERATPDRYTLSPEQRAKATAYARARYFLYFVGVALSLAIYFFLWCAGTGALFSAWAGRVSRGLFGQCLVFVPLVAAVVSLIEFPLDYYEGFALEHRFGLSVQSFGSWLGDWGKNLAVTLVFGVIVAWVFYRVIRSSPGRWWFYFWLVSLPLTLALFLIQPVVIDPLFYRFTPLEKTQPALTARIEAMLHRAGLEIPRSRIFEMNASAKTKTLDAYVTGVARSKRVVVFDNTLRKLDEDEILLVLGHETGHYALHHIPKEFALLELIALALSYLGFVVLGSLIGRLGPRTGVTSLADLAALPLALLVLTALMFSSSPIVNGISRHYEHQADQFGLEVTYGVVSDPNSAEARSLEKLGEEDLADPDPPPFIKFWLFSHPPLDDRIRFAVSYKPWAEGKPMQLLHPRRP